MSLFEDMIDNGLSYDTIQNKKKKKNGNSLFEDMIDNGLSYEDISKKRKEEELEKKRKEQEETMYNYSSSKRNTLHEIGTIIKEESEKKEEQVNNNSSNQKPILPLLNPEKPININTDNVLNNLSNMNYGKRASIINAITNNEKDANKLKLDTMQYQQEKETKEKANKINKDISNGNYSSAIAHVLLGVPQKALDSTSTTFASMNSIVSPNKISNTQADENELLKTNKLLSKKYEQITSNIDNDIVKTASEVSGTIGGMVPSIISNIALPGSGVVTQGINVGAQEYQDTLNEDASNKLQATITGAAKGIVSGLIEKISGGNIIGKGSLDDSAAKFIESHFKGKVGQKLASKAYEMIGEIGEENLENQLGYIIDKIINNKELPNFQEWWSETKETTKGTFLTTLVLNALGLGGSTYNDVQDIKGQKYLNEAKNIIRNELNNNTNINIDEKTNLLNNLNNVNTLQDYNNYLKSNTYLQQNQVNKENNIQTQQIIQEQNKMSKNQMSGQLNDILNNKELPMQSYQYEKSDNVKINNLRQDANKYFNNSEKARNYVNMLEKIITDKNIDIRLDANLKTADGRIANGSYSNGVITINPNSTRAGEFIAIHELTHAIGTKEMINMINTYRNSNTEFDTAVKGLLQNYEGTEISEEALSDISAQLFGNQEFINNIAQNNPNIFQKLYSEIKYLWHQFRGYKNQDQFIEDLYYKWTQAYKNNNSNIVKNNEILYNANERESDIYDTTRSNTKYENPRMETEDEKVNTRSEYEIRRIEEEKYYESNRKEVEQLIKDEIKIKFNFEDDVINEIYNNVDKDEITEQDIYDAFDKHREITMSEPSQQIINNIQSINKILRNTRLDISYIKGDIADWNDLRKSQLGKFRLANDGRGVDTLYKELLELFPGYFDANITNPTEQLLTLIEWRNITEEELLKPETYRLTDEDLIEIKDFILNSKEYLKSIKNIDFTRDNKLNTNTTKYSIQESENNSGSFSIQDNQGRTLTKEQQEYFKDVSQKLRDENGNIKEYYHGTQRADRVGNYFDPNKATSGPMAFFTDNSNIAKSYSENKQDTSISREADTEYDLFKANGKDLDSYWNSLTKQQQEKINKKGRAIGFDENYENIVYDENNDSFSGQYDYYLKNEEHNNGIKALYDVFIQDGNLFGEDMAKFKDVLALAGINDVEYLDPYKIDSKVYNVYLKIKNPFDTSSISSEIFKELDKASKHAPTQIGYSADQWDKSNITPIQWMNRLKDDIENGTTHAWTSIPDWVTNVLKNNGYDGIVDNGGKNGGEEHQVVIPFYSNQIKNIDNLNPTDNPDIRYSQNNETWQSYLDKNYKATGTRTNLQDVKLPIKVEEKSEEINFPSPQDIYKMNNKEKVELLTDEDYDVLNKIYEKEGKTEVLTEKKKASLLEKYANDKYTIKDSLDILAQKFINKGHYIDQLAEKTNNLELKFIYDKNLNSFAEGQYVVGVAQTDNNGNEIGKSINEIWEPIENSKLTKEFSEYLLHKHNIDRSERGKYIFGEEIGPAESTSIALELEKKHPEFKQYAEDIKKFNHNNLNNLKEAGMLTQDTIDYIESMYPNYIAISRNLEDSLYTGNNEKTGAIAPLKKATGGNSDIQPIKDTMAQQAIKIKRLVNQNQLGKELAKTLKNAQVDEGVDIELSPTLLLDMNTMVDTDNQGNKYYLYFENGKQIKLKINDNLYESLKPTEISKLEKTLPVKMLQKVTDIHRSLLTSSNPIFVVTNFFKDFQDGAFNSKYSSKFIKNYGKALNEIYTKGKYYQSYMANGGMTNTYFDYNEGIKKHNKFIQKIRNINEIVEQLPRMSEFISTLEDGKSLNEALYNAAEITTNFKRGGDIAKALNRNGVNFLNASIQGLDKQFRNFSGQNGAKGYVNLLAKATIMSIIPSVLNHMLLDDDDDYQDLPQSTKDLYYLFKYDDGKFIRIPKGRVLSIFGAAARRTIETVQGQNDAWEGFGETIINQIAPNNPLEDNILSPIAQVKNNKTWYGGDLVSSRLQKELPENQYDETTDEFSKWLGKQIKVSPKKINYLIDQYSGGVGDILLPMITPQAKQNVLIDKFTTDSVLKNKNVSKFYETLEKQTQIANDSFATDEDQLQLKYLNSISKDMSDLYKQKREIQMSNISNKEKTRQVKEIQSKINELAEKGINNYSNLNKTNNSSKIGDEEYYRDSKGNWTSISDEEKQKIGDLSLDTYSDYKQMVYQKTQEKRNNGELTKKQDLKNKDKIQILLDSKYSNKEITAIYENYIKNEKDTQYDIISKSGIDIKEYLKYKQQEFESDKKDDGTTTGKTVSGSKKKKVYEYVNSMNISYNQRLLLLGMEYTLTNSEKTKLANYVNNMKLTKQEKLDIYEKLSGFTVYKNGRVTW